MEKLKPDPLTEMAKVVQMKLAEKRKEYAEFLTVSNPNRASVIKMVSSKKRSA
jgi:hypothetical protein